jgi:predicted enzyme related to lactoylglutathione lyase
MGNPVVHFEVMGHDKARLERFFSELFGWRVDTNNPMGYGVVAHSENYSTGGVGIGGGIFGDVPEDMSGVTFYVEVDDVDETLKRAEELGGRRMMGPDQAPGGPVFGHLRDPEGHWIGLFQKGYAESAQIDPDAPPKGSPVVHFEVIGKDFGRLESFYGALFGWKLDTNNPVGYGVIARDQNVSERGIGIGGGIMALSPEMAQGYDGHVTFYVEVPDVDAVMDKAQALGGWRLMGPETVPGGPTLGQIADPEGHLIGLTQAGTTG